MQYHLNILFLYKRSDKQLISQEARIYIYACNEISHFITKINISSNEIRH